MKPEESAFEHQCNNAGTSHKLLPGLRATVIPTFSLQSGIPGESIQFLLPVTNIIEFTASPGQHI